MEETAIQNQTKPLVVADESSAGPFCTGGAIRLPAKEVQTAIAQINRVKGKWGVAPNAEIHCRVLFAGHARLKSPFKKLDLNQCHEMLLDCVTAINAHGGTWWGGWVNRELYPTELQMIQGHPFEVTSKHLAGLSIVAALTCIEHHDGPDYRLAFDADPTKIDWGLARRVQATHFQRTHPQAVELSGEEKCLLEMADIAAYTVAQSLLADYNPTQLKHWQHPFPPLLRLMEMRTARFAYTPWLHAS